MKIGVVGTEAVGGYFGGLLSKDGNGTNYLQRGYLSSLAARRICREPLSI
ncbi:MAG TPA: hypothetical protein VEY68_15425 [Anoxybacillus sp.]|jgi:ketopantoate reductase|nr:hypothetical protein [Anoxybacillus sp.]